MVLSCNYQHLLEASSKVTVVSLPTLKQNELKLNIENTENKDIEYNGQPPVMPFAESNVFYAPINNWRRLTAENDECKCIYEITFDVKGSEFKFQAGDTIGVIPQNNDEEVNYLIKHLDISSKIDLGYNLSLDSSQKGGKIPAHIPIKSTLRHVFTYCVDLRCIVKKLFLLALSHFTKSKTERQVLEYLCSKEGSSAYTAYVLNKSLTLLDIFKIFPTCIPPVEILLKHLPRLLPRPYSITNSGAKNNDLLKICFSVLDDNRGLTTGWMERIILNENNIEDMVKQLSISETKTPHKIPMYIRKNINRFSMPNLESPLLLIGIGTGVSPFIGFLEEREFFNSSDINLGYTWLFFGCRNPELDFIYEEELKKFKTNGILNRLTTAYSRIENYEYKYVQDALMDNGEEIITLMNKGTFVYICGDVKVMAPQIKETFVKCFIKYDNKSQEEAEEYMQGLQKENRYLVDVWN